MPLIQPRPNRVKSVRHITRLQEPNRDALVLYARFIGDTADYVLNELIGTTLAKDDEFVAWRTAQPADALAKPGESWRTLLQGLRTKIFLALSDDFSARMAADLCGKAERLKPSYSITESGQDARVSMLTGRPASQRTTVSAAKTYSLSMDYVFQPKAFAELQNGQAIVLPYDGVNPHAPTYCYLKPYYLDVQTSHFDHVAAGAA